MAQIAINGSTLGSALQQMLTAADIEPGSSPSYELCKTIFLFHPLGAKIAQKPIEIAQSQARTISIPDSPEEVVREQFLKEWKAIGADKHIKNTASLARVYGLASIACLAEGVSVGEPMDYTKLWQQKLSFNVFDPLNTAGSLVLNQNPMAIDFQHTTEIRVSGNVFHRSRSCVMMNEDPIYIAYTVSAFGFVGRSVYQRALYPLKSFIQTMITDDMVARKVGVIVAMIKQAGSIIDRVMTAVGAFKRNIVKEAETDNVISVGDTDKIESLNLQNLDAPLELARRDILENIASATPMPAKLLTEEEFVEGFGEGTEDAKAIARYVDGFRDWLEPLYAYFTKIVQHRAWNPDFYKTVQRRFPAYEDVEFDEAFYRWSTSFVAEWPSLLTEPESEKIKVDDVRLRAIIALVEVLMPALDPDNRAEVIQWACDNFNSLKRLFDNPLDLDFEALAAYQPEAVDAMNPLKEPAEPKPFAASDSARAVEGFRQAVASITDRSHRLRVAARREVTA